MTTTLNAPTTRSSTSRRARTAKPRFIEGDQWWRAEALCQQIDPSLFSPGDPVPPNLTDPYDPDLAKMFCRRCPVMVECGLYAVEAEEPNGVWGGTDPAERTEIRKLPERSWRRRLLVLAGEPDLVGPAL